MFKERELGQERERYLLSTYYVPSSVLVHFLFNAQNNPLKWILRFREVH